MMETHREHNAFYLQIVEALPMRWFKRGMRKATIAIAGMLLLLMLMVWVPVSAVGAHEGVSGLAGPAMVQATPTEDATVTLLNKEKLAEEVAQQQHTWENWLWSNAAPVSSTLVIVLGALFGLGRWLGDRRNEREKRVEERFQAAVTGLGDEKEGAKIGAAILLRTFLRPGYERFYIQIFQLVVANLRLPRTSHLPEDPTAPLAPALSQALIMAFMEAFPLARKQEKKSKGAKLAYNEYRVRSTHPAPVTITSKEMRSLNAIGILLDNGFLWYADLRQMWMPQASLQKADLTGADLRGANLYKANLSEAYLWETNLSGANLWEANLSEASLYHYVDLQGATLRKANLSGASLQQVDLRGADLTNANPEDALSLQDTNLHGVKGLTKEQLEKCKARGAIIDEDPATSSSQPTVSTSPSSQSNDAKDPSAPPAQEGTPTPDKGMSGAASSQQDPDS
jgi:uncharacterized protein YjbI with pentapeptide repeats